MNSDEYQSILFDHPTILNEEQILQILNGFNQSLYQDETRSTSHVIKSIDSELIYCSSAARSEAEYWEFPVLSVQFEQHDKKTGLAIIGGDDRFPTLFYFTEKYTDFQDDNTELNRILINQAHFIIEQRMKNLRYLRDSLQNWSLEKIKSSLIDTNREITEIKKMLILEDDLSRSTPVDFPPGQIIGGFVYPLIKTQWH